MRATLTILGLYNYDTSIFESLHYPQGLDGSTLINTIIFENESLEIMYPDPTTMKFLIGLWSQKELPIWTKLYELEQIDYNPIDNYNRHETWTDSETENTSVHGTGSAESTVDSSSNDYISAFNQTALVNSAKTVYNEGGSSNTENNTTGNKSNNATHSGTITGNIGVTTTQEMLEQELKIRPRLNIYDYIADSFKKRFCLMVY